MEGQLLAELQADGALLQQGCTADRTAPNGVRIDRRGHHVGIWHWRQGVFAFTPAGYGESTIEVETVAEAVLFTRLRLAAD